MSMEREPSSAPDPYAGYSEEQLVSAALEARARGQAGFDVENERGACGTMRVWMGRTPEGYARVYEFQRRREVDPDDVRREGPAKTVVGIAVSNPYERGWKRALHGGIEWF